MIQEQRITRSRIAMRTLARALSILVVTASLLVAAGPMQASAALHVAHAAVAVPTAPAAPTPQGYTRIRHYTNKAGFDRIARDGLIRAATRAGSSARTQGTGRFRLVRQRSAINLGRVVAITTSRPTYRRGG